MPGVSGKCPAKTERFRGGARPSVPGEVEAAQPPCPEGTKLKGAQWVSSPAAAPQDRVLKSCHDPAARHGVMLLWVRPLQFSVFSGDVCCEGALAVFPLLTLCRRIENVRKMIAAVATSKLCGRSHLFRLSFAGHFREILSLPTNHCCVRKVFVNESDYTDVLHTVTNLLASSAFHRFLL